MHKFKFDFGDKVRVKISGTIGIVLAKAEWYDGTKDVIILPIV